MLYQTKELYTRYKEQNYVYKIQDSRNILNSFNVVNCENCLKILNDSNILKCIFMSFLNCLKILKNQKTNKCSRTCVRGCKKKLYARAGKFPIYICTREDFPSNIE